MEENSDHSTVLSQDSHWNLNANVLQGFSGHLSFLDPMATNNLH